MLRPVTFTRSIAVVTFAIATAFLKANEVTFAGYIVGFVALMEAPAIQSGLLIAHLAAPQTRGHAAEERRLAREFFTNGAILLLIGSLLIGWETWSRISKARAHRASLNFRTVGSPVPAG